MAIQDETQGVRTFKIIRTFYDGNVKVTASQLRMNIYRILDQILESGEPVEVVRKGRTLRILPEKPVSRLDRLQRRPCIVGDPEDLVEIDWSKEWTPNL